MARSRSRSRAATRSRSHGALTVDLPGGTTLELRAADGARPTLLLDGEFAVSGDALSSFTVNGLVLAAGAGMAPGSPAPAPSSMCRRCGPAVRTNLLAQLNLTHCTLVPGWAAGPDGAPLQQTAPTLIIEPAGVELTAEKSILGAVRAAPLATVNLCDSIIDATDAPGSPMPGSTARAAAAP